MKEFKVNEYLTLKLEGKKTNIYVNNEQFRQCRFLLIEVQIEEITKFDEFESIDEAAERLDRSLETRKSHPIEIPSETEFWGHCSNMQAWAENNYNTRLLHRNIAFSLLKKLSEAGDRVAKEVFQTEIINRIKSNFQPVSRFLIEGGYLSYLDDEKVKDLFSNEDLKLLDLLLERMNEMHPNAALFNNLNYISNDQFNAKVLPWFRLIDNDKKFWIIREDCLDTMSESCRNQLINRDLIGSFFESFNRKSHLGDHLKKNAIKAVNAIAKYLSEEYKNEIVSFLPRLDFEDFSDLIGVTLYEKGIFEYLDKEQKSRVINVLKANLIKWYSYALTKRSSRDYATYFFKRLANIIPEDLKRKVLIWIKTINFTDFCFITNKGALDFLTDDELKEFLIDPQMNLILKLNETIKTKEHWYFALDAFNKLSKQLPRKLKNEAIEWLKKQDFNIFLLLVNNEFLSFLSEREIEEFIQTQNLNLAERLINLFLKEDSLLGVSFFNSFGQFLTEEDKKKLNKWVKSQSIEKLSFLLGNNSLNFLPERELESLINSIADDLVINLLNETSSQQYGVRGKAINALVQIGNAIPLIYIKIFESSYKKTEFKKPISLLNAYVLNKLDKDKLKSIIDDPRSKFIETLFVILENEEVDIKKTSVIGFHMLGAEGINMIIQKLNSLSESKKFDFIYNLFESGYFSYSDYCEILKEFLEKVDQAIYQTILKIVISKFMKKWEKQIYNVEYLFRSEVFRTFSLLNESKHQLVEESLKDEINNLIDKKIPALTVFLYLEYFLEDMSSIELVNIFTNFKIERLSDVFREIFKFRTDYEEYDWMLNKFEKVGDIGLNLFQNLISKDINWEIKEALFYRIKNAHGLDFLKNYLLKLLDNENRDAIKILFGSEMGYEIKDTEKIALFEQTTGNLLELFARAIRDNKYLAESYLYLLYENESDINRDLILLLKKQIIKSFKDTNLDAISFLSQFQLIYCFSREELIALINDPTLNVVASLIITSTYPPLASYRFFNISSTKYVLQYVFANLFDDVKKVLKKELILVLKSGNLDFLRHFIEFSFYGFQEFTHNHLYEYLDEIDYDLLFNDSDSNFKNNLIEILQTEQEEIKNYLYSLNFLIWLKNKIGEDYIDDIINIFKKLSPKNFNHIFSSILNHLSGPISAQKLKEFVGKYYIPFKEVKSEEMNYVEISGEKFYVKDDILDLNASRSSLSYMKKIKQISEIKNLIQLKNLKVLRLDMHQIAEIEGLDQLENLEFLSFRNNRNITEIKGLKNLINLKTLYLDGNQITEIKGLDNLINLETLWLGSNKIKEIQSVNHLISLKELRLTSNSIEEIKGLNSLTKLKALWLGFNKIKEIKNLENLKDLETLLLTVNNLTEIKGLENLVNLKYLQIKWNKGSNLFPQELIEKLGGINDKGEANDPQKFIEYCKNLKEVVKNDHDQKDSSIENLALRKMGVKTDPDRVKYKLVSNEKLQKKALDKIKKCYGRYNARTSYHGNVEYISVHPNPGTVSKEFDKIEELKYLINLQTLFLQNVTISDFEWFYYMPKLETLQIKNCTIKKDMNLAILKGLKEIIIHNSKIKEIFGIETVFNTDISNNSKY